MDARRSTRRLGAGLALAGIALREMDPALYGSALRGLALGTLALELLIGAVALFAASLSRDAPHAALGLLPIRGGGLRLLAAVAGALGLSAALDGLLVRAGLRDDSVLAHVDALISASGTAELGIALAGLALAPALAEELLCRGVVQRELARRAHPALAVLGASLLFGALHLEWVQGGAAALLGLYLGCVAWRTGSCWSAILCHLVNNAVAVLSSAVALPVDSSSAGVLFGGLALAALGIAALPRPPAAAPADSESAPTGGGPPVAPPLQSESRSDEL